MKKKLLPVVILFLVVLGWLFYRFELQQEAEISTKLDARSKEFLEKRQRDGVDPLQYANINEKGGAKGGRVLSIDECFKITIPFPIKFVRRDGECDYTVGISKPSGSIVIYQRTEEIDSIDQVPGVSMRRQSAHAYKESSVETRRGKFLIFEKSVDGYEKNAFYFDGAGTYIVVNMLASSGGDYKKEFVELLSSISE